MKSIKLRAWDKSRLRMECSAKWVEFRVGIEGVVTATNFNLSGQLQSLPVMQSTGKEDKNGFDIYAGDLIQNKSGRIGKVIYNNRLACFDTECTSGSWRDTNADGFMPVDWSRSVTVIGNIHENPELAV